MLHKVTYCARCISANTRPHQLGCSDQEMHESVWFLMSTIILATQLHKISITLW